MVEKKIPRHNPSRKDAVETRSRLILEAGMAFAKDGYGASLRNICTAAEANLGAIKYYFGSKQALYREVLIQPHLQFIREQSPPRLEDADGPEEALRKWIEFFLRTVLLRRRHHPYLSRLMIREFAAPTFALDELIQTVFKGVRWELVKIVAALTGLDQKDERVGELANIVIMLCIQQEMGRAVFDRFGYPPPQSGTEVNVLAEKIYRFALAGINTWI